MELQVKIMTIFSTNFFLGNFPTTKSDALDARTSKAKVKQNKVQAKQTHKQSKSNSGMKSKAKQHKMQC